MQRISGPFQGFESNRAQIPVSSSFAVREQQEAFTRLQQKHLLHQQQIESIRNRYPPTSFQGTPSQQFLAQDQAAPHSYLPQDSVYYREPHIQTNLHPITHHTRSFPPPSNGELMQQPARQSIPSTFNIPKLSAEYISRQSLPSQTIYKPVEEQYAFPTQNIIEDKYSRQNQGHPLYQNSTQRLMQEASPPNIEEIMYRENMFKQQEQSRNGQDQYFHNQDQFLPSFGSQDTVKQSINIQENNLYPQYETFSQNQEQQQDSNTYNKSNSLFQGTIKKSSYTPSQNLLEIPLDGQKSVSMYEYKQMKDALNQQILELQNDNQKTLNEQKLKGIDIDTMKQTISSLEGEKKKQESKIKNLEAEIQKIQDDQLKIIEVCEKKDCEAEEQNQQLADKQRELIDVKEQINEMKQKYSDMLDRVQLYEDTQEELQNQISKNNSLEERNIHLNNQIQHSQNIVNQLQQQMRSLQEQLPPVPFKQVQQEITQMQEYTQSLEQKLLLLTRQKDEEVVHWRGIAEVDSVKNMLEMETRIKFLSQENDRLNSIIVGRCMDLRQNW